MTRWTCDTCGTQGETEPGQTPEQVNCPVCGEPVVADPTPQASDIE